MKDSENECKIVSIVNLCALFTGNHPELSCCITTPYSP